MKPKKHWATYIEVCESFDWDHDYDGAPHEEDDFVGLTIIDGDDVKVMCGEMWSLRDIE